MKIKKPTKRKVYSAKNYKWFAVRIDKTFLNDFSRYFDGNGFAERNPNKAYLFETSTDAMEAVTKYLQAHIDYRNRQIKEEKDIQKRSQIKDIVDEWCFHQGILFCPIDVNTLD